MAEYVFDNVWHLARRRLAFLEETADPATLTWLRRISVGEGWRCWDVGEGSGSIVRWLSGEVGPTGHVLATDIDTRLLDDIQAANVQILAHDVVRDPLPPMTFDLVHTRLVLMHLAARNQVLPRLISALKPGGWILLEEHDTFPVHALATGQYARVWKGLEKVVQSAGAQPELGRQLPQLLRTLGLDNVGAEALTPLFPGGAARAEFWSLSWEQLRGPLIASGVESEELDRATSDLRDPEQWFCGPAMVAVWGRKPVHSA